MAAALAAHLRAVAAVAAWAFAAVCVLVGARWSLNRWRYRRIPGPFAPPIIGNLLELSRRSIHEYLDDCRRRYGRLFKVYAGSKMFIIVADPELARRVHYKLLNHEETLGPPLTADRRAVKEVRRSKSIFCARDDEWRALRMAWQPAFSPAALEGYAGLMDDCALRLAALLEDAASEGRAVDMCSEVGRMTLSVVGTCAYGVDFNVLGPGCHGRARDPEADKLVLASQRFFKMGVNSGFLGLLLGSNGRGADGEEGGPQFDDSTIIAQSNGFIVAGYETTANTLAYAVWAISAHPRVQARVLAEVDAFGRGRAPGAGDLAPQGGAFPYLQAVIKEAMRLFPAVPMMHREVTRDEGFELLPGLVVPKGERLFTAMYCYQRDEAFWPRPLEFAPERFLPEGAALAPSTELALTPFGGGARMCIGYRFAQQEALLTLVRLYQRLTFELEPGMVPLRLRQYMTLCPKHGVMARPVARAT